jgi:hypothetical protein
MKETILILTAIIAISFTLNAQNGNNQIGIAFDADVPTGDFGTFYKTGFGGTLKGLYGIGTAGQITLTTGYNRFTAKGSTSNAKETLGIIPVLLGYRHNISGLFIEPQIGYGRYSDKVNVSGNSGSDNKGAFTWAVGAGYQISGFEFGVRFQSGKVKDPTSSFSFVGLHIGYNFSLGQTASK